MIAYLGAEYGLEREDAYMLCSVAGDLRLLEVVDMPNYLVRITCNLLFLDRGLGLIFA